MSNDPMDAIEDNDELSSMNGLGVTSVGGNSSILTNESPSVCMAQEFAAGPRAAWNWR